MLRKSQSALDTYQGDVIQTRNQKVNWASRFDAETEINDLRAFIKRQQGRNYHHKVMRPVRKQTLRLRRRPVRAFHKSF